MDDFSNYIPTYSGRYKILSKEVLSRDYPNLLYYFMSELPVGMNDEEICKIVSMALSMCPSCKEINYGCVCRKDE